MFRGTALSQPSQGQSFWSSESRARADSTCSVSLSNSDKRIKLVIVVCPGILACILWQVSTHPCSTMYSPTTLQRPHPAPLRAYSIVLQQLPRGSSARGGATVRSFPMPWPSAHSPASSSAISSTLELARASQRMPLRFRL